MSSHPEGGDVPTITEIPTLDYDYLFEQASLDHLA
jgi:hypothetical protein